MDSSIENILALYDQEAPLEMAYTIPAAWTWTSASRAWRTSRFWQQLDRRRANRPGSRRGTVFYLRSRRRTPGDRPWNGQQTSRLFQRLPPPCGRCGHRALRSNPTPTLPLPWLDLGLDGSLKGTPEFAGVCNFDRAENGLLPMRVETWENFIFVNLDQEAPELQAYLGDCPSG